MSTVKYSAKGTEQQRRHICGAWLVREGLAKLEIGAVASLYFSLLCNNLQVFVARSLVGDLCEWVGQERAATVWCVAVNAPNALS